jgi:acetoin utilization deacetylase AcuC-like enzyme
MILYDSSFAVRFRDYGVMLPVSPDRAGQVLKNLEKNFVTGTRGSGIPYPGPVFDTAAALAYLGEPGALLTGRADLERVHSGEFVASLFDESALEKALLSAYELVDEQGRPHRYEPALAVQPLAGLFSVVLAQAGGTYLACRLALAPGPGFCYFLGGGMHHARYDCGAGFCLVNDVAIAARKIQAEGRAAFIWVIDLDAHKGDGTAELLRFARERGELDDIAKPGGRPCILTLSIHMARGWPLDAESLAAAREGRAPLLASDVDIGVDEGEETEYLSRLVSGVRELECLSAAAGQGAPDLVIVVDGADPYEYDELPSSAPLKLNLGQCFDRDMYVYRYLADRKIPSAWILAGGYGARAWEPVARFLGGLRG